MKNINITALIITVFVISWVGILPQLLDAYGYESLNGLGFLEILMTLGPILGAVVFIYKSDGIKGLKSFFSRLLNVKAPIYIILFVVLLPIVISFLSSYIGLQISNSSWPENFTSSAIISNGLMIFVMYLFINTEELVWRGIVFDRLLDKYGFIKACLVLIPIWWLFHMPLFMFPEGHPADYGLIEFTCIVISQTFILGWIYIKTKRSLFYVHLHHQLMNGFGQAFPLFPVFIMSNKYPIWVFCGLLLITSSVIAIRYTLKKSTLEDPSFS